MNTRIWEIDAHLTKGGTASSADVAVAEAVLRSGVVEERIIACRIIFCSACSLELQKVAIDTVESICEQMLKGPMAVTPDLLLLLLWIPKDAFHSNGIFRRVIFIAAKDSKMSVRANAVLCLERLSQNHDREAKELLAQALTDPENSVRTNAQIVLQRLKQ